MRKLIIIFTIGALMLLPVAVSAKSDDESQSLDKKNLVVKEWITDSATGRKYLDHVTTWNADGRKATEKEYDIKSLKWSKRYEYDAKGNLTRELTYNAQGKLDNIRKYEYNGFGKKKTEYTYDAKGNIKRTKTYEYIVSK